MENNFKNIKESVIKILYENYNNNNDETNKVWSNFLLEARKSNILKNLILVYNNIENNKFTSKDTAEIFLNENLMVFNAFTKQEIKDVVVKTHELLREHLTIENNDILYDLILESSKDRKLSRLNIKAELFNNVVNTLIKEEEEADDIEKYKNVDIATIQRAIEIINEKYSFLDEIESGLVKAFVTGNNLLKEEYFNILVSECLNKIRRTKFDNSENDELLGLLEEKENKLKSIKFSETLDTKFYSDLIDFKND